MTNKKPPDSAFGDSLAGLIETVTFHNPDTGFAVLRVGVKGRRDLVSVVGSMPAVNPGEWLVAEGQWERDKEHGLQFKAQILKSSPPSSREGIEKYLGSGLIKGVGPVYARKLVARFGEEIFNIIDHYSVRLEEVEGIGPERRRRIRAAWLEQKAIREIMVFLHSNGVSTSRAGRIYKAYGDQAIEKVRANPYALAKDIVGIGFKTADQIAQRLGVAPDSFQRICAGLTYRLLEATQAGHCGLPRELLIKETANLLGVSSDLTVEALTRMITTQELVREMVAEETLIYHPPLLHAERGIAAIIGRLAREKPAYPAIDVAKAVAWHEARRGKTLAPAQQAALSQALTHRVLIITGGPGVGKTTLIDAIIRILSAKGVTCLLCAPTGRAAKRLSEATEMEAKTIHRLLEFQPGQGGFKRHEQNPLAGDLLVVDEVSMLDVLLMHKLLKALPAKGSLILVGDVDQLPAVGPGMVLRDLIDGGMVPVARLQQVFRQASHSQIIEAAHAINAGKTPNFDRHAEPTDFYFIERDQPEQIVATLRELVRVRIPRRFGFDPVDQIQVLCPMNRGSLGTLELNRIMQGDLNPRPADEIGVEQFGWRYQVGDKVMQIENNYDKGVFNGDLGRIKLIQVLDREVVVGFDQREVVYDFSELDELSPAYAMTIHKAQGSEFPAVVLLLAMQHYLLLQRNLIYTGITRGKQLVVVLGQRKALLHAIHNSKTELRHTGLQAFLAAGNSGATNH